MPGEYSLYKGLGDLHDDDEDGILTRATPAVAGATREHGFDRCEGNGGPGQTIATYLPKGEKDLAEKLEASLTPSAASQAAVAAKGKGEGNGARNAQCFRVREKRLSAEIWRYEGQDFMGSHFPICAFTNNVGRRDSGKLLARRRHRLTRAAVAATGADTTSRNCGDAWVAEGWRKGDGSHEGAVGSSASSSSWAGAGQADATQTLRSESWEDWQGSWTGAARTTGAAGLGGTADKSAVAEG